MSTTAKIALLKPEFDPLIQAVQEARVTQDKHALTATHRQLSSLYAKHGMSPLSPLKGLVVPFIQIPLFLGFFWGISDLCVLHGLGWDTGGILWFQNLALPDPAYALPILNGAVALKAIEFQMLSGRTQAQPSPNVLTAMRLAAIIAIPFMCNFQSGIFLFWITSSLMQMGQSALLLIPKVRQVVGLPPKEDFDRSLIKGTPHQPWHLVDDSKLLFTSLKKWVVSTQAQAVLHKGKNPGPVHAIRPAQAFIKRK
ncbi:Mitochondrial inner membrane protein OXA1 [Neolecta irregularis DAH-3]|uniref:Mitochondrial inner membrane protein OXA1 n=1 Tax=Neolecta irregularis (strain DAH-3) TaxID=1198029 RepID=A0A1U7LID2_NEOID|nr:Mitochondrial inner membrane protein OXA1 [Neolecta irregularis DAH-3]|eukprot:OLL22404.1 Mitochondrial inner membrane protein OXA1 [Neolecta irregularis DAH-3]